MRKYLIILSLISSIFLKAQDNSNWGFVGPKVDATSGFNPELVNCIAVDPRPGNLSNYYVGASGGIWMSNNSATSWQPMDPNNNMVYGGSTAMAVDPSTGDVYIASTEGYQAIPSSQFGLGVAVSAPNIYRLQSPFGVQTWNTLAALPVTCLVHNIQFNPSNNNYLYACTTAGLFFSSNKGASWTTITSTETYNIIFIADGSTTYCYVTGSNIFLASANGVSFTHNTTVEYNLTHTTSPSGNYTWVSTLANICVGDISTNTKYFYIKEWASNSTNAQYEIYQLTESGGTVTSSTTSYIESLDAGGPGRLALGYVQSNGLLFYGGIGLYCYDTKNAANVGVSIYHGDNHAVVDIPSATTVLEGSDGGFCTYNYSGYSYPGYVSFTLSSNGLNISQIDGFSGSATAADNDTYVLGDQDAQNGWSYKVSTDQAASTQGSSEPAGGIIDKFNDNIVIMNSTQYYGEYDVSTTGSTGPFNGSWDNFCDPNNWSFGNHTYLPNNGSTFTANQSQKTCEVGTWARNTFFQDPSRPDKIYYGTSNLGQWDPSQNVFAVKVAGSDLYNNSAKPFSVMTWFSTVISVAISPVYKNGFYFTTESRYWSKGDSARSQIVKFIGPDIDDSWWNHNEDTLHWIEITPNLNSMTFPPSYGFTTLSLTDQYNFAYINSVVSNLNPNKIWVACSSVPHNPYVKVLQYDNGVWTDYSQGLPVGEQVRSLQIEIGSNDGMYLGTDRGIYYRNASMSTWQTFDNYLPHTPVNQLEVNYNENTLRAGTYGRGIWKSSLQCSANANLSLTNTSLYPTANEFDEAMGYITSTASVAASTTLSDGSSTILNYRGGTKVDLNPGFQAIPGSNFFAYIHPCSGPGNSTISRPISPETEPMNNSVKETEYKIDVFPNPNQGTFTVKLPEDEKSDVTVFDLLGRTVYTKNELSGNSEIDLTGQPKGIYFIKAISNKDAKMEVKKIIVQ